MLWSKTAGECNTQPGNGAAGGPGGQLPLPGWQAEFQVESSSAAPPPASAVGTVARCPARAGASESISMIFRFVGSGPGLGCQWQSRGPWPPPAFAPGPMGLRDVMGCAEGAAHVSTGHMLSLQ